MRRPRPALNLNGYTDLPPGKLAAVVTYLEMRRRPRLKRRGPGPWTLEAIGTVARYRELFAAIGQRWLWFSRLSMPDAQLEALLGDARTDVLALVEDGRDIGLLELDFRQPGECELAFFGLVPEAIGRGAGRALMDEAIRRAFRRDIARLTVHTCSLDHPGAVGFYVRSGFVPYKRAIEVADDPRLSGKLPRDAAPHVPLIPHASLRRSGA